MSNRALLAALALLCAVLFAASVLTGPADAGIRDSLVALFHDDGGPLTLVMREIRLPRAVLGLMAGASLGLAGAAIQGFLRNPLAEPGLIGVSASAALGAVLAIHTGLAATAVLALPLSGLAGALVAVALILGIAGGAGQGGRRVHGGPDSARTANSSARVRRSRSPSGRAARAPSARSGASRRTTCAWKAPSPRGNCPTCCAASAR